MRTRLVIIMALNSLGCAGCAAVGGAIIEGLFDSVSNAVFDSGDDDCELDDHTLKRKGIERGSHEHKRLEYHENFQKEFYKDFNEFNRRD